MRIRSAGVLAAAGLLLSGCEPPESERWPDQPPGEQWPDCGERCQLEGCIDGIAWNCGNPVAGDCAYRPQADPIDCNAAGLLCWSVLAWSSLQSYCAPPGCGDGVLQAGEECDYGPHNGTVGSSCLRDCTFGPAGAFVSASRSWPGRIRVAYSSAHASAEQTFAAGRSGILTRVVLEDAFREVWIAKGLESEGAARIQAGPPRSEGNRFVFDFEEPVQFRRGEVWRLGVTCADPDDCSVPLLIGDSLRDGAFALRPLDELPPPWLPTGSDLWFTLWIKPNGTR